MNLNFLYFTDFKNYITPLSSDQYFCKDLIIQFINNELYMKIHFKYESTKNIGRQQLMS